MAMRYLRSARGREEGRRFIRFITYVAVGGVALGTAALLLALSIVRGFSTEIEAKIVGFGAHVQVESFQDEPLDDAEAIERTLEEIEGVAAVAPVVQEFALLRRSAREIEGVAILGIREIPTFIGENLISGAMDTRPDTSGRYGVVVGRRLAERLGVEPSDIVTAFSMREEEASRGRGPGFATPRVKQFRVTGVYETALADFDELYVYTDIAAARELLGYGTNEVTRFDLTVDDVGRARDIALEVEDQLGFPIMARSIYEVYSGLFAWVNLQEGIIPIVISVIILVAAFNIIGTLLMLILEKTREIGILQSLGASRKTLRKLFLWLGLLIGVGGTLIGQIVAFVLAVLQQKYAIIPLPEEAYYMDSAPIELNVLDFVLVGVVAMLLCTLAAYLPARVASRIEPIRAIHFR